MSGIMTINSDLNPAGTMVKETIAEVLKANEAQNELNRGMSLDFFEGRGNKAEYLENYGFKDRPVKIPKPFINLMEQIIKKTSLVYKRPPGRKIIAGREEDNSFSDLMSENKALRNGYKTAERYKNAMSNILYRPMWYNNCWNSWYEFDFIPYFKEGDPLRPFAYSIPVKRDTTITDKNRIEDKEWFMFWSDEFYYWHDNDGNRKPDPSGQYDDMKNPFGRLPFVELRKKEAVSEYWPDPPMDIVLANQAINVTWCDLIYSQHNQAFSQPYIIGARKDDVKEMEVGADKYALFSESDMLPGVLDFNPKIIELLDSISRQIEFISGNYDLKVQWSQKGNPASGFALLVENIGLMETRQDDVEWAEMQEDEIYDVIQAQDEQFKGTRGYKSIGLPKREKNTKLIVDFQEIEFPVNESEQREKWDWEIKNNAASIIDYIMLKEGLNRKDAEQRHEETKEINTELSPRDRALDDELKKLTEPNGAE